jgi:hypothetical protein
VTSTKPAFAARALTDIRWHPLLAPPDAPEVAAAVGFFLANPTCTVLSATKPA